MINKDITIYAGDSYSIPVLVWLKNCGAVAPQNVQKVEFKFSDGSVKLFPDVVGYDDANRVFTLPISQAESFAWSGETLTVDTRVKFDDGDVVGTDYTFKIIVKPSASEEVL